jgi:starch synthase
MAKLTNNSILFAASEAYPLVKTGGLGDVIYSLPQSMQQHGGDVRIVLPGYRLVLEAVHHHRICGWMEIPGHNQIHSVRILEVLENPLKVPLYIVDCAALFDRPGNPYQHPDGYDWHDNAERFTVFARAVAQMVTGGVVLGWRPNIVHCHDWQTGLIPPLLKEIPSAPSTIFTIHNLAYTGLFSQSEYLDLGLPAAWWSMDNLEFYGNFSMLKAGICNAHQVTTVSPQYAQEICTPEFGYGLEGALIRIQDRLHGILNGIDTTVWDPAHDPALLASFSASDPQPGKQKNKAALLARLGVDHSPQTLERPLLAYIGRLIEQKGVDLLLGVIPIIIAETNAIFVLLGSGEHHFEQALLRLAHDHPDRILLHIGYDESLAHQIEAGADIFTMPSRFEPCGLNQFYSLRYGTPPIVYNTGGLADSIIHTTDETLDSGCANGFVFNTPDIDAFHHAISQALQLFNTPVQWEKLMAIGMQKDFDWKQSAEEYCALYQQLIESSQ